jgi:hypothetical protein
VLQSLHLGVLLHDSEGKVVFANARLAEMWGMDEKTLAKLSPGRFHERISGLFARPEGYLAGLPDLDAGPFEAEQMLEPQRPRRQVLRWTALPIRTDDGLLQLQLWEEITAEVDLQAQRAGLVAMDALTELLNRRGAEEELLRETARAKRNKRPYTLLRIYMHDRPGATPPTAKDEDVALSIGPKHLTAKDRAEGQAASRELEKVARQREKDGFFIPMMWTDWEKRQLELLDRGLDPVTDGDFKRARMRKWLRRSTVIIDPAKRL